MLVLTRRLGETIVIADNVRVRVLAVCGNSVRLGIKAPDAVRIMRAELLLRAASEGSPAAEVGVVPDPDHQQAASAPRFSGL